MSSAHVTLSPCRKSRALDDDATESKAIVATRAGITMMLGLTLALGVNVDVVVTGDGCEGLPNQCIAPITISIQDKNQHRHNNRLASSWRESLFSAYVA